MQLETLTRLIDAVKSTGTRKNGIFPKWVYFSDTAAQFLDPFGGIGAVSRDDTGTSADGRSIGPAGVIGFAHYSAVSDAVAAMKKAKIETVEISPSGVRDSQTKCVLLPLSPLSPNSDEWATLSNFNIETALSRAERLPLPISAISGISEAKTAVSKDITRTNLMGVFFDLNPDGRYEICATDGHRLIARHSPGESIWRYSGRDTRVSGYFDRVLIPELVGFVSYLNRPAVFRSQKPADLALIINDKLQPIGIEGSGIAIYVEVRSLDNYTDYPHFPNIFPTKYPETLTMAVTELVKMVNLALPLANERTHMITLKMAESGAVSLWANDPGVSDSVIPPAQVSPSLNAVYHSDTQRDVVRAFNGKYLLELLGSIPKGIERVTLQFSGPVSPCVFEYQSPDRSEHLALIMPLRLTKEPEDE